ncbi:DUF2283 domain-containing protein [Kamptonema animale CS-326]|jgi:uncharacterized protein YuzE|uniref:DUF2283 domain-containing protein n=1 Tax=Kamptonema animale TaxID=92934 RepID=UPI0023312B07|nr:DUF2283 domain-containing protein [Kamptonema animale]MDB9515120.1 DUF2283 domain-containing protein [Kamptonema animale CS-326]
MKLTYDPRYNVAYIYLKEKPTEVETVQVSGELNIDIAPDGTIYGIELLNANQQLGGDSQGKLIVINEALGESSEIKLALSP